jgi:cobyrinic acid a,c-diamide synthase
MMAKDFRMNRGFLIAATGSGCGKTTITCGLLMALKQSGHRVRSFKCGPDYIDPMFHKKVLGIPSKNLDLFFSGSDGIREVFYRENDSEISVVEGVMGLYDGMNPVSNEGSSYEVASVLDLPVVLIVDAHGMGRSILAVISGFLQMDIEHRIAGVILNKISKSYYGLIKPVIEEELGIAVFGYLPKQTDGTLESRYLGLKLPEEVKDLTEQADALGKLLQETVDLERLLECSELSEDVAVAALSNWK